MNKNLRVLMIGPLARTGGVANHTVHLTKALRDAGLQIILYNSNFDEDMPKPIINIIKIYRRTLGQLYFSIKNRASYDIVHVQASGGLAGFLNAIAAAIAVLILRNKKMILTFHYSDTENFVRKYKHLTNVIINLTVNLLVVSDRQRKSFLNAGVVDEKIKLIPNGYSPDLFSPIDPSVARARLNLPVDRKILVNIGHLEEYKGQKYLIESMRRIVPARQDIMLNIVGQGSLMGSLQSRINKYGIERSTLLAGGNKPPEEIPLWLNACDVFVLPSLNEGNPTVMFEALGCGKPFVGTSVGGIPDIIINEKLGILVEPGDPEGLADAILRALETEWDKEYIREYAGQFTWGDIAKQIIEVYESVYEKNRVK